MSRTIESQIHAVLLEIAPDTHELDEQAVIIAEAAEIYRVALDVAQTRTAKKGAVEQTRIHEARIMDSLLQAMNYLPNMLDESDDETPDAAIDGRGLSPDQIVHRVSVTKTRPASKRTSSKKFGDNMDILSDDDLDAILNGTYAAGDVDEWNLNDGEDRHAPSLFRTPGMGKHRTDGYGRA